MSTKNIFIPHRWDNSDDYDKIAKTVERAGLNPSDRSVSKERPLDSKGNYLMHDVYNKIDSASVLFVPARPSSTREGSVVKKEIDYALKKGKQVIAVDTGSTTQTSTYLKDMAIVANRKDSIANAVKKGK